VNRLLAENPIGRARIIENDRSDKLLQRTTSLLHKQTSPFNNMGWLFFAVRLEG